MRNSAALLLVLLVSAGAAWAGEDPRALVGRLGSADPVERRAAREALREAGADGSAALREGLLSPKIPVAVACADLVREGGILGARAELREVLGGGIAPRLVRHACCLALGRVGDYRDVELLGGLLPEVPAAALALAEIADPDGLGPLREAFAEEGPPEIAYALAALGDDAGFSSLISALDGERRLAAGHYLRRLTGRDFGADRSAWERWWRRRKLARALGHPDWDRSEAALARVLERVDGEDGAPEELVGDLLDIALDREAARDARTKSILALGLLEAPRATRPLLDLLRADGEGMVRVYAAEALGRIGDVAVAPDLAYYLVFDEEPFRKRSEKGRTDAYFTIDSEVSKALVKMGISGGLDFMIRQLGEPHRVRVLHEAVLTLRKVTGKEFGFSPDGSAEQRRQAAGRWRRWFEEHREEIRLPEADLEDPTLRGRLRRLVDRLGHFHFLNMSRALETLVLLGETGVPELRAGLMRPEVHVRVHCAEVLGRIRSKSSRGFLEKALSDEKGEVRTAAAAALADMGPGESAVAVVESLADPVLDVRIEAARALARVEASISVPRLRAALDREENRTDTFRREAFFSLAAHGDREAVDRLSEMLDHESVPFRLVVASRLHLVTGRDPGAEPESVARWREWWDVNRDRYTAAFEPASPR